MGVKQLNHHFNWINGLSFLLFAILNFYLVVVLEMKTFGYYYSISFKFTVQCIFMIAVIYSTGNFHFPISKQFGDEFGRFDTTTQVDQMGKWLFERI